MQKETKKVDSNQIISRRNFVKVGGAMIAGTTLNLAPIRSFAQKAEEEEKRTQIQGIADHYNWENIASRTLEVYKNVLNLSQSPS